MLTNRGLAKMAPANDTRNMQTLYESSRYLVTARLDQPGPAVVTFPAFRGKPGIERHRHRPWLGGHLEAIGCNWIAVTPEINDWYQHPDIEGAIEAINAAMYGEKPVTLGASMGGLAAWTLSGELNACGWAVFGANYSMKTTVDWDHRLMDERRAVEATHGWREVKNVSRNGHAWLDPLNKIDRTHAQHIARYARAETHDCGITGHNPLVQWKSRGVLADKLHHCINRVSHINLPVAA
jgi:hypothetical protein